MINAKIGYELEIGLKRNIFNEEIATYTDDEGLYRCSNCDHLEEDCCCCELNTTEITDNFNISDDGSIRCFKSEGISKELVSKVYRLNELKTILNDFKKITPFLVESNNTMGLHIHISFNQDDTNYIKLCSWDFVSSFQKAYLKNFKYTREQERKNNRFCLFYNSKIEFKKRIKKQIDRQAQRYHSINFMSFFSHRTVEFRLFPSTKYYKRFKKYLIFTVGFINQFLKKNEIKLKKERRLKDSEKNILIEIKESVEKNINLNIEKDNREFFICAE